MKLSCLICNEESRNEVRLPKGWAADVGPLDGFCPRHAIIGVFHSHVCAGCLYHWHECALWAMLKLEKDPGLTDAQNKVLLSGCCPVRRSGTLMVDAHGLRDIDVGEAAPQRVGWAVAEVLAHRKVAYDRYQVYTKVHTELNQAILSSGDFFASPASSDVEAEAVRRGLRADFWNED